MRRCGSLQNLILERNAFRIVLLEPRLRGILVRKEQRNTIFAAAREGIVAIRPCPNFGWQCPRFRKGMTMKSIHHSLLAQLLFHPRRHAKTKEEWIAFGAKVTGRFDRSSRSEAGSD